MNRPSKTMLVRQVVLLTATLILSGLLPALAVEPSPDRHGKSEYTFGVLTASDDRLPLLEGLQEKMAEHGKKGGVVYHYRIHDAKGDRNALLPLAQELIAARPDVALACGGIEADALKQASAGTGIPVIFLYASSSIERGLAESLSRPGGNMTGIDSNDTALTEKRLWYVKKIFPQARKITCFSIPSIAPSAASAQLALAVGPKLGLEIRILDIENKEALEQSAREHLRADNTDAVVLFPVAPIYQVLSTALLPAASAQGIPIFGASDGNLQQGAFASYSSNQRACGRQAAHLVIKILHGADPAEVPVETPDTFEFILNRQMIQHLGLQIPRQIWQLADRVVDLTP